MINYSTPDPELVKWYYDNHIKKTFPKNQKLFLNYEGGYFLIRHPLTDKLNIFSTK